MYASLVTGSKSHKSVTKEKSRILWSYYNNNVGLPLRSFSHFLLLSFASWLILRRGM